MSSIFFFLFLQVLQWAMRAVSEPGNFQVAKFSQPVEFRRLQNFATCEISQVAKFRRLHCSSPALSSSCFEAPIPVTL